MIKLLFSVLLSFGVLTSSIAIAATSSFVNQTADIRLTNLSFKEIMRKFYGSQMTPIIIYDEDIANMPYIGLGYPNNNDESLAALMHPVIKYKNTVGELRYLVIIEKVGVYKDSLISCHACAATVDIYSFKQLDNGLFQLVSRTPKKVKSLGVNGRAMLDTKVLEQNMQPFGLNLTGTVVKNGTFYHGVLVQWWDLLHLSENDFISIHTINDAGGEDGRYDEESPLYYSYEGILKVIPNNSLYYPIMLTYKGESPSATKESLIESINYSRIVKFDSNKMIYN